jgi:hypothetical protein
MADASEGRYDWKAAIKPSLEDPRFWIGILVAGAAVGLLWAAPHDTDLRGVYFASSVALFIAGLPQSLAALAEHAREEAAYREEVRRERDETRRICLIALAAHSPSPEAAATALNALTYHSRRLRPDRAAGLLLSARSGGGGPWKETLEAHVNGLCKELGDEPMFLEQKSSESA